MLLEVTPGTDALGVLGEELQAANRLAPSVTPNAAVTSTRVCLPIGVWLLCLIASPFLVTSQYMFAV